MQLAKVIGRTTATVKHESLAGWRMLIVQPLGAKGNADGDPVIAVDNLGGGSGDNVMITSDGKSVTEMIGSNSTPVRWAVIGIED
jgi:ethanolamine utilization protein EutN